MNLYPEIKSLAFHVSEADSLIDRLFNQGLDVVGIDWYSAKLVKPSASFIEDLKAKNCSDSDDYFLVTYPDFDNALYGDLYFRTDSPDYYVHFDYSV